MNNRRGGAGWRGIGKEPPRPAPVAGGSGRRGRMRLALREREVRVGGGGGCSEEGSDKRATPEGRGGGRNRGTTMRRFLATLLSRFEERRLDREEQRTKPNTARHLSACARSARGGWWEEPDRSSGWLLWEKSLVPPDATPGFANSRIRAPPHVHPRSPGSLPSFQRGRNEGLFIKKS